MSINMQTIIMYNDDKDSAMAYYSDTDPRIEKLQFDLMRQVPPGKKLIMVANLNQALMELVWSGLRAQYPHESAERLRRRLADRILGADLAERVYGQLLEEESHAG
jgi:hypothetical protein